MEATPPGNISTREVIAALFYAVGKYPASMKFYHLAYGL